MKKYLFALLFFITTTATAQWRIQIQAGPAFPLKSQSKDSLFFAKQGLHIQAKATYYFGHLGLCIAGAYNKHNSYDDAGITRPPLFLDTARTFTGNGWNSSFITAGPEFCFPYKKIKFQLGLRAGVALQTANRIVLSNNFNGQNTPLYTNELRKKVAFAWQADAGAILYSNTHFGYGITANLSSTTIRTNNQDRRFGFNNIRTLKSNYTALAIATSLVYKF